MLRCACAALAVIAALLAWPAFAQDEPTDDQTTADESAAEETAEPAADEPTEEAAEEPEEEADEDAGEVDHNRTGLYASLAFAWGVEKFTDADDIDTEDAVGFNARVGYRMRSWLSVEGVGEFLPKYDVDFGPDSGDLMVWNAGANLRFNLPTGLIQPYLIAGGGYYGAEMEGASAPSGWDGNSGFGRIGGGMEFYPWEHIGLDAGVAYLIPAGDVEHLDYLSITFGALYRF